MLPCRWQWLKLTNRLAADLCKDGRLDTFDLVLMRQELMNNG